MIGNLGCKTEKLDMSSTSIFYNSENTDTTFFGLVSTKPDPRRKDP